MKFSITSLIAAALSVQLATAAAAPVDKPTRIETAEKRYSTATGQKCYYICPSTWKDPDTGHYYSYKQQASAGACEYNTGDSQVHVCAYSTTTGTLFAGGSGCTPQATSYECVPFGTGKKYGSEFKRGGIYEHLMAPRDGNLAGRELTNREKIIKARQWNPKAERKQGSKRGFNKAPTRK